MSASSGPNLIENGLVLNVDLASNKCISNTSSNPFQVNNIITRSLYTNVFTTAMTYTSDYGGSLTSNSSGSGFNVPAGTWTNLGLTNNFTINLLIDVLSTTGIYVSTLCSIESYLTRGFRLGFYGNPTIYSLLFWTTESGGNMEIYVSNTVLKLPERLFLTVSFDSVSGVGKVYKNGNLVGSSPSGRTLIAPNSSDPIDFNQILNSTSTNLKLLHKSIYNRALSDTEVLQNYKALRGRLRLS